MSHDGGDRLPRLWRGVRRHLLVLLVLVGLGQAAAAGAGTRLMIRALHGSAASRPGPLFAVLIGAALLVGALRMVERIWAERLSQHYVHEVRLGLLRHILGSGETRSLGVAMTRTSNDLTSVKNWIALGIAPLVVGIPIIAGAMTVLAMINTAYAVAFAVPLLVLLLALLALRRPTLLRTRSLRRSRGRLAQQVADTVLAARTIQISGGARRELERMAATSSDLMSNAISRARFAGALRGAAAATTGLGTAAVIWAGIWAHRPAADTTAALTVVAFLVAPIQDLGRITEYRQTYVAARAMLGPAIGGPAPRRTVVPVVTTGQFGLQVGVLWRKDGHALPAFLASPGDRIIIAAESATVASECITLLAGVGTTSGVAQLDGLDLAHVSSTQLRAMVGYAAQGLALVRGTIARNIRYRVPAAAPDEVARIVDSVGLALPLALLPGGIDTRVRHGGEPLSVADRARVQVARALLGSPSLLLLDRIDADLGPDGRRELRAALADYAGIVVIASDDPVTLVTPSAVWDCRVLAPIGRL